MTMRVAHINHNTESQQERKKHPDLKNDSQII